ncbi:hypothetical protein PO909_010506 [Leuciscus waleckii]
MSQIAPFRTLHCQAPAPTLICQAPAPTLPCQAPAPSPNPQPPTLPCQVPAPTLPYQAPAPTLPCQNCESGERLSLKFKVKWSCHLIEMCIIWIESCFFQILQARIFIFPVLV